MSPDTYAGVSQSRWIDARAAGPYCGRLMVSRWRRIADHIASRPPRDAGAAPKVVALMRGFSRSPSNAGDPPIEGANVNLPTSCDDDFEEHTGMPRRGALSINVTPAEQRAA